MKQLMAALNRGVNGSSLLIIVAAGGVCWLLLRDIAGVNWWGIWVAIAVGLVAGVIIGKGTEYFTSYDYKPTRRVADSSKTGPATVIIAGIALGMKSTWMALTTVIVAILVAFSFAGGFHEVLLGLYGIGIAAVGMLATLGITLATDAYGPIADNAGGNAEMTHQAPEVRKRTDALDSLGNTTAAVGKGFAIGSAALTALALLAAYVEEVRIGQVREGRETVVAIDRSYGADAKAGVGKMVSLGHGKIGIKSTEGTGDRAFDGLMVVEEPAGFQMPTGELKTATLSDFDIVSHSRTLMIPGPDLTPQKIVVIGAQRATYDQYMTFYGVTLMNPKVL